MTAYALVDCGHGRRLEQLGGILVKRPAPAAQFPPALNSAVWDKATLEFSREHGWQGNAPADWRVTLGGVTMALRPANGGQVGIFPEHAAVAASVLTRLGSAIPEARVLNLFAHTGFGSLRLAQAGAAEVTHVDAAGAAVRTARDNAVLSGLEAAPVRWLVDDAATFMRREIRRSRQYEAIMADPPSYGRSGKNEWKLARDLPELLGLSAALLRDKGLLFCLTCHSEGWDGEQLAALVRRALPDWKRPTAEALALPAPGGGHSLPAGWVVFAGR